MPPTPHRPDRRTAVRERHHRAILDAAAALMDETRGTGFTVDDLAARADVSRRTVFNHFGSMDDVVIAVCTQALGAVVANLQGGAPTDRTGAPGVLDELTSAVLTTDLAGPLKYLGRVLGGGDSPSPRVAGMLLRALTDVGEALTSVALRRHPDADPLHVHLLVGSLMSGLVIIYRHWSEQTGGADDERSQDAWAGLLDRLLTTMHGGYGDPGPPPGPSSH